ncbi:MAG TPA: fibronectin type III domain-containing protein, partial [Nocardioidaceae bacterium]|nr:fibronectin type III domain-containing protein [Nocardioidaceae bacterium]
MTVSGRSPYSVVLRKLTNGEQVEVAVRAGNSVGWSRRSRVLRATPVAPAPPVTPSAPKVLEVTPGAYGVVVRFAPSAEHGDQVTGYQISADGGKTWKPVAEGDLGSAGTYTVTMTGLPAGQPVQVVVRAMWAGGSTGGGTDPVVETPYGVPGAVTVKAKGTDGTISVVFAAPKDDGGALVTGYQVDYGQGWTDVTVEPYGNGTGLVVTRDGLVNGTTYPVRVRAVNKAGAGAASVTVQVTPHTVPGAPVITKSQGFDGAVAVSFTAPVEDGGAPVTGYQISYGGDWFEVDSTPTKDGVWKVVRSGFTNGNTYPVHVRALNRAGHGPASVVHVTPVAVPDAPVLTGAVAGDGAAELTIAAPAHDGGKAVSGYQVSTDGGATWSSIEVSGESPFTVELEDLLNGVELSVLVRAGNEVGWSTPSNALAVTPLSGAPSAPRMIQGVGSAYQVAVTFDAPVTNPDKVTGYQYSTDGGETWTPVAEGELSGEGPYTLTLTGLDAGTGVDVWVRAVWSGGTGAPSDAVSATPYGTPGAPSIVNSRGIYGNIMVSFEAPHNDGGSPVTSYQITYGGDNWTDVIPETNGGLWRIDADGFTNGVTYPVQVRAVNAAGKGQASEAVDIKPIVAPNAPTLTSVTSGDRALTVVFDPPPSGPSNPVTGYQASTADGFGWYKVEPTETGDGRQLTFDLTGLTNGVFYEVAVRATNLAGESPKSATLTRAPSTVPGAPTLTSATADKKTVTLAFTAPQDNGGSVITKYQYQQDDGQWQDLTHTGTGPYTATITDLANATYTFKVRAVNAAGVGDTSNTASVKVEVLTNPPAAPTVLSAYWWGEGDAMFSYRTPANNGAPITGYEWTWKDGDTWQ